MHTRHIRVLNLVTLPVNRRAVIVGSGAWLLATAIATMMVLTGRYDIGNLPAVLRGDDPVASFLLFQQRLPRALTGLAAGAILAASGAVFQSLTRNPLGSPDLIGFTSGSATGGIVAILVGGGGAVSIGAGALIGGAAVTAVVLGVTIKGRLAPELMILVGIAVAAFLGAADDILLNRAALEDAEAAKVWQFGSLNIVSWPAAWPLLIMLTLLLLSAPFLSRPIRVLELGDDTAVSFGVHVARVRLTLTAGGVLLVAAVVAAVGPIGFIALAAPRVASWLTGSTSVPLLASTGVGAAATVAADLIGQHLLAPFQIPVGLVAAALGGMYLLLVIGRRSAKERRAAA